MAKYRGTRKSKVLGTTKKIAQQSVGFLEKGISDLFGIVKTGVSMSVKSVKKGANMLSTKRNKRLSKRRSTRRRKY